jgi:hypothetical protein
MATTTQRQALPVPTATDDPDIPGDIAGAGERHREATVRCAHALRRLGMLRRPLRKRACSATSLAPTPSTSTRTALGCLPWRSAYLLLWYCGAQQRHRLQR